MLRRVLIWLFIVVLGNAGLAQLSGTVIQEDENPIEGVLVFQEGSSLFSITDKAGRFTIDTLIGAQGKWIVSHISYQSAEISISGFINQDSIVLVKRNEVIDEVLISEKKSGKRKKWLKRFSAAFLGTSDNGKKAKILNPEVVLFKEDGSGKLIATASDLIRVDNERLGYKIQFLLEEFILDPSGLVRYKGKPLFSNYPTTKKKQQKKWDDRRLKTFKSSLTKILKDCASNSLDSDLSFTVARLNNQQKFEAVQKINIQDFISIQNEIYEMKVSRFMAIEDKSIKYKQRRSRTNTSAIAHPAEAEMAMQSQNNVATSARYATSFLFSRSRKVKFNRDGVILNPEHIAQYGYLAQKGVADMLPLEFTRMIK